MAFSFRVASLIVSFLSLSGLSVLAEDSRLATTRPCAQIVSDDIRRALGSFPIGGEIEREQYLDLVQAISRGEVDVLESASDLAYAILEAEDLGSRGDALEAADALALLMCHVSGWGAANADANADPEALPAP